MVKKQNGSSDVALEPLYPTLDCEIERRQRDNFIYQKKDYALKRSLFYRNILIDDSFNIDSLKIIDCIMLIKKIK